MQFQLTQNQITYTFKVDSLNFLDTIPKKYWKYSSIHKNLYCIFRSKYINYVELIRGKILPFHSYRFKNGNCFDLRKQNIKYYDLTPNEGNTTMNMMIVKSNKGTKVGFRLINPYWKIISNKTIYYMMHIKDNQTDKYVKFSVKNLSSIKSNRWFLSKNGYPTTHRNKKLLYMHNVILEDIGYCHKLIKIEHINQDRLDNRIGNIKVTNPIKIVSSQEKRLKNFARIGISESEIPTCVRYTQQYQNHGEFFQLSIRLNGKTISHRTSKSIHIPIEQKLIDILAIRAKIVIDNPELLLHEIDGKNFTMNRFIKHTKKLINKYAQQGELDLKPDMFNFGTIVIANKKPNRLMKKFPENSKYTPDDLPKYTVYIPPKNGKGSYIEYRKYDAKNDNTIRFKTTSKNDTSLDEKIVEINEKIEANSKYWNKNKSKNIKTKEVHKMRLNPINKPKDNPPSLSLINKSESKKRKKYILKKLTN